MGLGQQVQRMMLALEQGPDAAVDPQAASLQEIARG